MERRAHLKVKVVLALGFFRVRQQAETQNHSCFFHEKYETTHVLAQNIR